MTLIESLIAFDVEPHESILAAALRAEVNLPHDCKTGTCGSCRFKLVEGGVAYAGEPMGLSPEEESEGFALACQATPTSDIVASAEVLPSTRPTPELHRATVKSIEALSNDVVHLVLELPDDTEFTYLPGQYVNILTDDGAPRSFSMASQPAAGLIDLHIRRIPGGSFTQARLAALKPGDTLDVELPHGAFFLRKEDYRPMLMVATGTGLAPIKSMIESLMDDPDCPPVALYWGMRTEGDLYLHHDIPAWGERLYEFQYVPVLSRAGEGWQGRRGYVQQAVLEDIDDLSDYAIYLCGSPEMVAAAKSEFLAKGASANHIYADSFLFQHNR